MHSLVATLSNHRSTILQYPSSIGPKRLSALAAQHLKKPPECVGAWATPSWAMAARRHLLGTRRATPSRLRPAQCARGESVETDTQSPAGESAWRRGHGVGLGAAGQPFRGPRGLLTVSPSARPSVSARRPQSGVGCRLGLEPAKPIARRLVALSPSLICAFPRQRRTRTRRKGGAATSALGK